jgi:hypothetical protein
MMLRVESMPSQNDCWPSQNQAVIKSPPPSPTAPLFINLNTASHHKDGTLLHVGRKDSDVPFFQNEKSLSRQHCRLRLISLDGTKSSDEGQKEIQSNKENMPLYPKNEEEKAACENSIDGLAIVLEDLGRLV